MPNYKTKQLILISILTIILSHSLIAQVQMGLGVPEFSFTGAATTPGAGTSLSLPGAGTVLTWATTFTVSPASITVILQTSTDNSTWSTADTTTSIVGEARTILSASRFARCNITASSGGSGFTCSLTIKSGPIAPIPNTFTSPALFADGIPAAPSISFSNDADTGWYRPSSGGIEFSSNGAPVFRISTTQAWLDSAYTLGWSPSNPDNAFPDLTLGRDAADTLALRRGINAQTFNTYTTYTDASNYRAVKLFGSFSNGMPGVYGVGAGTGTNTDLYLSAQRTLILSGGGVGTNGHFQISAVGVLSSIGLALASLGTPANGSWIYCTDCLANSVPCTGASTGAFAKRLNGAWDCR